MTTKGATTIPVNGEAVVPVVPAGPSRQCKRKMRKVCCCLSMLLALNLLLTMHISHDLCKVMHLFIDEDVIVMPGGEQSFCNDFCVDLCINDAADSGFRCEVVSCLNNCNVHFGNEPVAMAPLYYDRGVLPPLTEQVPPVAINYVDTPRMPVEGIAFFVAQCDNIGEYSVSYDGGDTFSQLANSTDWFTDTELEIENVTPDTIIRAVCKDTGVVGGFIATVVYRPIDGTCDDEVAYSTGPDMLFEIIDSSDGEVSPIVYTPKDNTNAWGSSTSEMIDDGASWVWNSNIKNEMTFQFDFGKLAGNGEKSDLPVGL